MRCKQLYLIVISAVVSGCGSFGPTQPPVAIRAPAPQVQPAPAPRAERSEALLQALLHLGVDYKYGGKSPSTGFDCSGLVAHIYKEAWGIRLPMNTKGQAQAGVAVSLVELQAGDLVFYDTQKRPDSPVGILLRDGQVADAAQNRAHGPVRTL